MPTFGDYETVGEPLGAINLQGHVSTVWKARKTGARDDRDFVVKIYAPHRRSKEGGQEEALDRDRGLEFLEGVKQLKKAQSEGASHLSPIHDLGISSEGAWFVTDYYPRNSLMALIERRAKVDSAALKQIVRCVVSGCLALKKSRGVSHGNLKASNVFLVGKPRPLPKTPLVLADPYPAAPLQLARLDMDDRKTVGELLHQVMEVQDLRALGEIILQLVERRAVRSGYDYNYPIARSEAWENLGKDGERWRQICNQLLDPQLSLVEINLDSLAKKFPARVGGNKLVAITGVVVVICLVGGLAYGFAIWNTKRHERNCHDCTNDAQQALQRGDLEGAKQKVEDALKWEPKDNAALSLSNNIEIQIEKKYALIVASADEKFKAGHLDEAINDLNEALGLKPDGVEAKNLKARIEVALNSLTNTVVPKQRYQAAMDGATNAWQRAEQLLAGKDYPGALKEYDAALGKCGQAEKIMAGPPASQLRSLLSDKRKEVVSVMGQAAEYAAAMGEATNAWQRAEQLLAGKDYSGALKEYDAALRKCGQAEKIMAGPPASQLRSSLSDKRKEVVSVMGQAAEYAAAMGEATNAWQRAEQLLAGKDYPGALKEYDAALGKCGQAEKIMAGPPASQLRSSLSDKRKEVVSTIEKVAEYAAAMQAATNAWNRAKSQFQNEKFDAALTEITNALRQCATARNYGQGPEVDRLESTLNTYQGETQRKLTDQRECDDKLNAGHTAQQQKKWAEAANQFGDAVKLAKTLKDETRSQSAQDEQEYSQAMDSGEKFLPDNPAEAKKQALLALGKKRNDSAALDLQERADEEIDFANAQRDFDQCLYDQAQKECKKHEGVSKFKELEIKISTEKTAFDNATNKFAQGDYSFIEEVGNYRSKSHFFDLLKQATPQAEVFNKLKGLVANPNNWSNVEGILTAQSNASFINKEGFGRFRSWANQNDPVKNLNDQLEVFKVWYGFRKSDAAVIDPTTRQPAKIQPKGTVDPWYYTQLGALKTNYIKLEGTASSHVTDIKKIENAMNRWDQ